VYSPNALSDGAFAAIRILVCAVLLASSQLALLASLFQFAVALHVDLGLPTREHGRYPELHDLWIQSAWSGN